MGLEHKTIPDTHPTHHTPLACSVEESGIVLDQCILLSLSCRNRARVSAGTAINALVSVDLVLAVTLVDSFSGAVLCAVAARDAIVRNDVCHVHVLHVE